MSNGPGGGCENQLIIGMVGKTTVLSAAKGELHVEMYDHKAFIPTNHGGLVHLGLVRGRQVGK